jgi:hypothetical protein
MAGFAFIVLLLLSLNTHPEIRVSKIVFVVLLGLYVGLGTVAIIDPALLIFRNLSFMIDLLVASILFRQLSGKFGL